ncbi:hypothetical protein GCM10017784_01270 [Deinococcus indicus]|nr:hypothetical protein GCM10017784_01270 [Deinococcus indicus]
METVRDVRPARPPAPEGLIRTPIEWAAKPIQSERSEWEQDGFRTWSQQSGEVPDCWRNKRNPYERTAQRGRVCAARPLCAVMRPAYYSTRKAAASRAGRLRCR